VDVRAAQDLAGSVDRGVKPDCLSRSPGSLPQLPYEGTGKPTSHATTGNCSTSRLVPLQIDVPQTVGYYGGIGAALAFGLLEPRLAAFIAAVPLIMILAERGSPIPVRFLAEVLEGAARPVGSDADGTVRLADPDRAQRDIQRVKAAAEPVAAKRHAACV
jgi:hypothetical protein